MICRSSSVSSPAASCQKVLGGWANIANEYATKRYRSNLINWGMLPFLIEEGELPFHNLDYLFFPDIRRAVEEKADGSGRRKSRRKGSIRLSSSPDHESRIRHAAPDRGAEDGVLRSLLRRGRYAGEQCVQYPAFYEKFPEQGGFHLHIVQNILQVLIHFTDRIRITGMERHGDHRPDLRQIH